MAKSHPAWNKGLPKEQSHLYGTKHSIETIEKMKQARAKQVFSQETKDKIRNTLTGKKQSLITRQRKSEARKGDKNPAWKGGISRKNMTERQIIMHSLEYKLWRESIFKRDNYQCIWGGKEHGNDLQADHIKRWSDYPELRFAIDNGRTLCRKCHLTTDNWGGRK